MPLFSPQHFTSNRCAVRLHYNALACKRAGDRMMAALARLGALVEKANFNPDQPRAPGPGPGAGQWIYVEGYAQEREFDASISLVNSPGIGHNGGPPLDEPPNIPKQDPGNRRGRLAIAKQLARGLARVTPAAMARALAIESIGWLRTEWASIHSYRDEPKPLEELIRNAQESRPGYHRHHIVEQTHAERDGYPRSIIDASDNVVSVPIYKHREISAWYQKANPEFGGLSPREYLRGKDWAEREIVGIEALKRVGVLKP